MNETISVPRSAVEQLKSRLQDLDSRDERLMKDHQYLRKSLEALEWNQTGQQRAIEMSLIDSAKRIEMVANEAAVIRSVLSELGLLNR